MFIYKVYNSIKTFSDVGVGIAISFKGGIIITLSLVFIILNVGYIKK